VIGDLPESLELYRQSLAAFEAVGDRAEEAREFVDRARVALSADEVARATEAGRRLTIKEALDLVRSGSA
jgi:hypothetical protein